MSLITSKAHPLLKRVGAVLAGKHAETVLLEGERLVRDALAAGWGLESVLVAEGREDLARSLTEEIERRGGEVRRVRDDLLARHSGLRTSPGILALAPAPPARGVPDLDLEGDPLLLAVAGIADPGNLGGLARSAEASGARALCVVAGGARPFGDKALRGSMGSLLRLPVVQAEDARALQRDLSARGVRHVAAATRGGATWRDFDWAGAVCLWVTGETGAALALDHAPHPVTIPMAGAVESLNVTVAASILLFAAGRAEGRAR